MNNKNKKADEWEVLFAKRWTKRSHGHELASGIALTFVSTFLVMLFTDIPALMNSMLNPVSALEFIFLFALPIVVAFLFRYHINTRFRKQQLGRS